jgi:transglutaminase-like putative cysteine protease
MPSGRPCHDRIGIVVGTGATVRYRVTHRTDYRYDDVVTASYSEAHLVPRSLPFQHVIESYVVIDPTPSDRTEHVDFYGNRVTWFSIDSPHTVLSVTATTVVEVARRARPDVTATPAWDRVGEILRADPALDPDGTVRDLALDSPLVRTSDTLRGYALPSFAPGTPVAVAAIDLCTRIHRDFTYRPGATTIATGVDEVLARGEGVCQDFAHLAVACLRALGLPARYVSGYLETQPPPGQPKLQGADASHAWAAVFVPSPAGEAGSAGWWLEIDPTNDAVPDDRYIVTAWGRDYSDVPPIKGVLYSAGSNQELHVAVDVTPLSPLAPPLESAGQA